MVDFTVASIPFASGYIPGPPSPGLREFAYSREPVFTGGTWTTTTTYDTRADAITAMKAITSGRADVFLGDAWYSVTVRRNRDFEGRFTRPAWVMQMSFARPGAGQKYKPGENAEEAYDPYEGGAMELAA